MSHSVREPVAPYIGRSLQYWSDLQTLTVHIADVLVPDRIPRSGNIRAWIRSQLTMHPTVNSGLPPVFGVGVCTTYGGPCGCVECPWGGGACGFGGGCLWFGGGGACGLGGGVLVVWGGGCFGCGFSTTTIGPLLEEPAGAMSMMY